MENTFIKTELQKFNLTDLAIAEIKQRYMPLAINNIKDRDGYKAVNEARIFVKNKRVEIEKTRKNLKEESLKFGRAVDAEAKRITALLLPIEEHLEAQQEAIDAEKERLKQESEQRRQTVIQSRIDALLAVGQQIDFAKIANMSDEEFTQELALATASYEAEQAALVEQERLRLEEEERLEKLRLEDQERQRAVDEARRAEEQRLAGEAAKLKQAEDERQRAAAAELEEKRKALERAAEELAEKEAAIKAAEDKIRRDAELEAARKEAAEKALIEADLKARREADAKAERERQEKAEAIRQEALKPDKDRALQFAHMLENITQPQIIDPEINLLVEKTMIKIYEIAAHLKDSIA